MEQPRIAITMGDPAGVGPELCLKSILSPVVRECCIPIVIGDLTVLQRVARELDLPLTAESVSRTELAGCTQPSVSSLELINGDAVTPGVTTSATGRAAFGYIQTAIKAALDGHVAGMVTGPINKEALAAADVAFPGHTEILAHETATERVCMMLTSEEITCSVVTAHVGLQEVAGLITTESVLSAIRLSERALRQMRGRDVKLVVCGLNPHAGEAGLFGNGEEERLILPAIEQARREGIDIAGPVPADTAFLPTTRATTDGYICMYHDQGLIPLKALAFDTAVNVTLGLPIVRTSVDHGTALDIAWQGKAQVTSMIEAIKLAARMKAGG